MALTTSERNGLLAQVTAHAALIMSLPVEGPAQPPAPTPPAPPPADPNWEVVANEGESFTLTQRSRVRYGNGSDAYTEQLFEAGTLVCSNATFGGDPAWGQGKVCMVSTIAEPPVPTPGSRGSIYFANSGSNSNPGTEAAPKRDLTGIDLNTLPSTVLYFKRGDTFLFSQCQRLENTNLVNGKCLTFTSYGTGPLPDLQFRTTDGRPAFEPGGWQDTRSFIGYEFIRIKLNGCGQTPWGIWFRNRCDAWVIDKCEITGFQIGIHLSDAPGANGHRITNNRIVRNSDMGILGKFDNSVLENNFISENNFTGSGFSHGTYLSGGHNATIRNNHYLRNSTVNGVGQGGNCTFHGQFDGLLIEGNLIEQDSSTDAAWQMSITEDYTSPEWFRNLVVRNNWFKNSGNVAMNAQACPGALIEQNVIINTQGTNVLAIAVGMQDPGGGDDETTGAVLRDNRGYVTNGSGLYFNVAPGCGTASNNTVTQGLPTEQYVGFNPALLD